MTEQIRFYGRTRPSPKYWPFSNFYHAPFVDGNNDIWPTTEHYFQAMKFHSKTIVNHNGKEVNLRKLIRYADTPKIAAELGRNRDFPLREDWETFTYMVHDGMEFRNKDKYMYAALYFKFTQHDHLKQLLLETNDAEIIESSPIDFYWGEGKDGSGRNMLGKLLQILREELRR